MNVDFCYHDFQQIQMLNIDHRLNIGWVSDLLFPHLHVQLRRYIIVKRHYLMIGFVLELTGVRPPGRESVT